MKVGLDEGHGVRLAPADMNRFLFCLLAVCCAPTACTPKYVYVGTTQVVAKPRAPGCKFDVLTIRPERPFDELGVLEVRRYTRSVTKFMAAIRPQVCEAGGDAVLTEVDEYAAYIKGTVLRYR